MKRYLADVNVWFALALEEHEHHRQAREWWQDTAGPVGFVRTTQLGLLRLLTSSGPMHGRPLTNEQAWAVYDEFLSDDRVQIFPEMPALEDAFRSFSGVPQAAPKRWVDAYLTAHAVASEATLVTFDQTLAGYGVACRILGGEL
jgi:toxin-antitoxin system PIN domain toxin